MDLVVYVHDPSVCFCLSSSILVSSLVACYKNGCIVGANCSLGQPWVQTCLNNFQR